jgi:hypothetical protein
VGASGGFLADETRLVVANLFYAVDLASAVDLPVVDIVIRSLFLQPF